MCHGGLRLLWLAGRTRRSGQCVRVGSLTKLFTATLLADLVARGSVGLDEAAAAFRPAASRCM
jgi:CubicO group peptidase (beta-lactamase class C family)